MVGLCLAVISVVCAGSLAWQFIGTTWVARAHQRAAISALTAAWEHQAPTAVSGGIAVNAIVRVPRFGPGYAVPLVEGTDAGSLELGIGHVVGTAHPGQRGNVVLAAHRVTHGEPFRWLPRLRPGDLIVLQTLTTEYTYRLTHSGAELRVPQSANWVLAPSPRNPDPAGVGPPRSSRLITLLTCAEVFHTSDRFVVFGEYVGARPRPLVRPTA